MFWTPALRDIKLREKQRTKIRNTAEVSFSLKSPAPSEGGRHFRPFSLIRQIFENALFFPVRNLYENIRKGAAIND